jgi:hypothetical protein
VLGYGLSQTVPDLSSINPEANSADAPKYLTPRMYQITVSSNNGKNSKYTNGTLNFCILTHRGEGEQPLRSFNRFDRSKNPLAGQLATTLFDLTRTREHDGIMGFATDLIWDKYFGPTITNEYRLRLGPAISDVASDLLKNRGDVNNEALVTSTVPHSYEYVQEIRAVGSRNVRLETDTTDLRGIDDLLAILHYSAN